MSNGEAALPMDSEGGRNHVAWETDVLDEDALECQPFQAPEGELVLHSSEIVLSSDTFWFRRSMGNFKRAHRSMGNGCKLFQPPVSSMSFDIRPSQCQIREKVVAR